ncbi:MAG: UPF0175 family protein [Acidobacteria bacterium]|nr:UPF0175 family protein [Acidobacteriota bacterium]
MEVTIVIPDDVASEIQNGSTTPLSRRLLELAAIQAYESDLITKHQVKEMLGFESRFEVDALFKAYDLRDHSFTMEELERGRATAKALFGE